MTRARVLTILGTLALGALGSGLWELAKPALVFLWSISLTIVTLGLDVLRDGIYSEVARGMEEKASRFLLSAAAGMMAGLVLSVLAKAKLRSEEGGRNAWRRVLDRATPFIVLVTVMCSLIAVRQSYVTSSVATFVQLEAIAAPFLTDRERLLVRGRFAQMTTRAEFIKLTDELKAIARRNGQKAPDNFTF